MEFLQSINGAISTDYTLHISLSVIGILLVTIATIIGNHFIGTLKKIEAKFEKHESEIHKLKTDVELTRKDIGHINQNLANEIVSKIKAITR